MKPKATIVVTQRERMSLTERSLESILGDRSEPFRLIYVDGGAPGAVADYLKRRAAEVPFELIRREAWLWPNVARNLALPNIDTEYVVFADNDIVVEPGWLKKLVACADERRAGIVGPLYLISDGIAEPRIHMAGGTLTRVETPAGTALHERHERLNAPLSERAELERGACDFVEYHCMLVRTDLLRQTGGLSEQILSVHEHIDIALAAKAAALPIIFEPEAVVTQHAFAPFRLTDDLPFHRWRWNNETAEQSLRAFCGKWNHVDDGEALNGIRGFVEGLSAAIDPLAPPLRRTDPQTPLAPAQIAQNLYALQTSAFVRGYAKADLERFESAYHAAMRLFAGGFRACSRPFLAHCTGTASALIAFGFAPRVVVAGLLHAAYMNAPLGPQPHAALSDLEGLLHTTFGERVERLIRLYTRLQSNMAAWCNAHPVEALTTEDAEVIAIAIANSIDECAAGETAFTGKAPPSPDWIAYAHKVAVAIGVPAFGETLSAMAKVSPPPGFDIRRPISGSFRLVKGGLAPMSHTAFRSWDEAQDVNPAQARHSA